MIGYHQEVQRPAQFRRLPGGRDDFLTAREAVCLLRPERVAEGGRVERIGGMEMRVTPQHPRRIVLADIGRIARRLLERSQFVGVQSAEICPDRRYAFLSMAGSGDENRE